MNYDLFMNYLFAQVYFLYYALCSKCTKNICQKAIYQIIIYDTRKNTRDIKLSFKNHYRRHFIKLHSYFLLKLFSNNPT